MAAYRIDPKEIEGLEPIATGYKVVDDEFKAHGGHCYADENGKAEGSVHKVDGELAHCKNGLHFCENPLDCAKYAQIVQWNNFLKVSAYGEVLPEQDNKRVARIVKVEKVLTFDEFISEIKTEANSYGTAHSKGTANSSGTVNSKGTANSGGTVNSYGTADSYGTARSDGTVNSRGTANSKCTVNSYGTAYSYGTARSDGTAYSYGTVNSRGTAYSKGTANSYGTVNSYGTAYSKGTVNSYGTADSIGVSNCLYIRACKGVYNSIFAYNKSGQNYLFNKKVRADRIKEVKVKIYELVGDWFPKFNNAFELYEKCGSWELVNPNKIKTNSSKEAYADMPKELETYLRSLPEFNEDVFNAVTGRGE